MSLRKPATPLIAIVALLCAVDVAHADPPITLWNFLGIPQGIRKIGAATINRRGNTPGLEPRPPLKTIADPKNLESKNPAIKKAAEIKTEEDLAKQKIKAIKYLAKVGCGCYPGVKEALLAALDDCTEEVRYQAVLAIQDATTQHCSVCNKNCCCDEELVLKLSQLAYERNDKGCFIEPSERVREAAKEAMCACCPGQGPISEQPPEQPPESVPEGVPTPPLPPESVSARRKGPDLARRGGTSAPQTVRVYESRTKIIMPDGSSLVADEGEAIEAVAADVEHGERLDPPPVPRAMPPQAMPPRPTATPASIRQVLPAPAPATPQAAGQSSRRAASERGLGAPERAADGSYKVADGQPARGTATVAAHMTPNNVLAPKFGPPPTADSAALPRQMVRGMVARVRTDENTVEVRIPKDR